MGRGFGSDAFHMTGSIIADTSVWINFFKGIESAEVSRLIHYIENDDPVYLWPTIIQEVLQGINNDKQYKKIKGYLLAFNILNDEGIEMAISVASLNRSLRKKGITIRKSSEYLIVHYAIKYSLYVLHLDRDFNLIVDNYK